MDDEHFEARLTRLLRQRAEHAVTPFVPGDVAREAISNAAKQRGRLARLRRMLHMTTQLSRGARYGLVALAAVGGIALLGSNLMVPTGTDASPSPVASVSTAPSPDARPLPVNSSEGLSPSRLRGARYHLADPFPIRVSFEVPEGYASYFGSDEDVGVWRPARADASGIVRPMRYITFSVVGGVYADPCLAPQVEPPAAGSTEAVIAALRAVAGFEASEPATVEIAGLAATVLELRPDAEQLAACGDDLSLWSTASGESASLGPILRGDDPVARVHLLTVDGRLLAVSTVNLSGSVSGDQELAELVGSVRIEPE